MIGLGGATRLTGSGLSITEWDLITGILPPLTSQDWHNLFANYQQSPEFQHINSHFTLTDFQGIFWLEYIHRLWGRLLAIPLIMLTYWTRRCDQWHSHYKYLIIFIWCLSIMQGLMGWIMVKSGLNSNPSVSPLKLSAHLSLAGFLVLALTKLLKPHNELLVFRGSYFHTAFIVTCITIVYGALVAGFKAGYIYNTFPLMGDAIIADDAFAYAPLIVNAVKNSVMIQWLHRLLATTSLLLTVAFCLNNWRYAGRASLMISVLLGLISLQYVLGITTLLTHVHKHAALAHQMVAFLVLSTFGWLYWNQRSRNLLIGNLATT